MCPYLEFFWSENFSKYGKIHFLRSDRLAKKLRERIIRSIISSFNHSININLFVPNANFLYPLKTSENLPVFWCFQGLEEGCIENKLVNVMENIYGMSASIIAYAQPFHKLTHYIQVLHFI